MQLEVAWIYIMLKVIRPFDTGSYLTSKV